MELLSMVKSSSNSNPTPDKKTKTKDSYLQKTSLKEIVADLATDGVSI